MHKLFYTSQARHDWKKIKNTPLIDTAQDLLTLLKRDPFEYPP